MTRVARRIYSWRSSSCGLAAGGNERGPRQGQQRSEALFEQVQKQREASCGSRFGFCITVQWLTEELELML